MRRNLALKAYRALIARTSQIAMVFVGSLMIYVLIGVVVISTGWAQTPSIVDYRLRELERLVERRGDVIDANKKDVIDLKLSLALTNAALLEVQKTLDKLSAMFYVLIPALFAWMCQQLYALVVTMRQRSIESAKDS